MKLAYIGFFLKRQEIICSHINTKLSISFLKKRNNLMDCQKNLKETEKELIFVNLKTLNSVKLQNINFSLVFYMELEGPKIN